VKFGTCLKINNAANVGITPLSISSKNVITPAQKPKARQVFKVPGFPLPCFVMSPWLRFATILAELMFPIKYDTTPKII
jgi:hypothetical protein